MDPVTSARLVARKGIVGNANQGGRRNVTVIEREVWERLMQELGSNADPSTRRANLMISGTALKKTRGQILHIGNCQIQIMGETKPCERMEEAVPGLRQAMYPEWAGGIYGIVLNDAEIQVGDEVRLEDLQLSILS